MIRRVCKYYLISVPRVLESSFGIDPITQTSISISLSQNTPNFDNGTLSVYSLSRYEIVGTTFDRDDFPITITDLPTETSEYNISFTLSVGTLTNCGNGAIVTSDVFSLDFNITGKIYYIFGSFWVQLKSRESPPLCCMWGGVVYGGERFLLTMGCLCV